ncbi:hypothetical protein ACFOUP_02440 [Belliella kenyensis]|uniref:Uncharacterized protein n=1 Tax=Belliella kenyensis TaxID=1472724 RepID=A0ABV8EGQ5_9BACT|nr:hypothetical protein [Belliella kenyensis]MCH7400944.1 hypothetical protein [Belliella kenyensis]MDN3603942.1 hypothetical protein [Belliella kenyensis]
MRLFFFVLIILTVSCKNESVGQFSNLTLDDSNTITLPVDKVSSNFKVLSQYHYNVKNKEEYLIHINTFPSDPNYIFFDNIDDPRQSFRLSFPQEGPNGVGSRQKSED